MTKHKILVVELDDDIRNMLDIYFTGQGYEVMLFSDLNGVIDFGENENADILIFAVTSILNLDEKESMFVRMWERNSKTKEIPIIFLSSKRPPNRMGSQRLFHDYMVKPFDIEEFKIRIENAINQD